MPYHIRYYMPDNVRFDVEYHRRDDMPYDMPYALRCHNQYHTRYGMRYDMWHDMRSSMRYNIRCMRGSRLVDMRHGTGYGMR